jgi:diadenosine tetraphosphate (Ap4A) HIT family hydrolase
MKYLTRNDPTDVLVAPIRPTARLMDLSIAEMASLMTSVQHVGRVIENVYKADGLSVVCQVLLISTTIPGLRSKRLP